MNRKSKEWCLILLGLVLAVMCSAPLWGCGGGSLEERSLDAYTTGQHETYSEKLRDYRQNASPTFKEIFGMGPDLTKVAEGIDDIAVYVYKDGVVFQLHRNDEGDVEYLFEYQYHLVLVFHPTYGVIGELPAGMNHIDEMEDYGEILYYLSRQ